jgi:hypothetical protein
MAVSCRRRHEGTSRNRKPCVAGLPGAKSSGLVRPAEEGPQPLAAVTTLRPGHARRTSRTRYRSWRIRNEDSGVDLGRLCASVRRFSHHRLRFQRLVFSYWETGSILDGLALAPLPAISGLAQWPFTPEMHDVKGRFDRYKQSRLSLTPLGKAILAGAEDFSRHNPIHRWWGGTELTNDRLWRWDPVLIAP